MKSVVVPGVARVARVARAEKRGRGLAALFASLAPVTWATWATLAAVGAGCSSGTIELPHFDAGDNEGSAPLTDASSADGGADASHGDGGSDGASAGDGGTDAGGGHDAQGDSPSPGDGSSEGGAAGAEVWVVRIGAVGAASAPDGTGEATFVDRFAVADGAPQGSIAMPVAASGADQPFTMSGAAASAGALTRSADGKSVVLAGYAATPGSGAVHADGAVSGIKDSPTTGAGAVLRVIARVDAAGATSTSFTTTAYSGNDIRGAATVDGSAYWMFGDGSGTSGGLTYQAASAGTPTFVSTAVATVRGASMAGGRVYATSATGPVHGVFTMVSALPTSAESVTSLPGFPNGAGPSPYGFAALALGGGSDPDTFYVCDDRSSAGGGGVQRWKLASGTWSLAATFNDSMTSGCRGIAAAVSGTDVTLFVTTTESTGNHLLRFADTAAGLSTATATKLADAPANTVFRGVALAPN